MGNTSDDFMFKISAAVILGLILAGYWKLALALIVIAAIAFLGWLAKTNADREAREAEYAKTPPRQIKNRVTTKIAGVTAGKRQTHLKRIAKKLYSEDSESTYIDLVREPDNKHDPNAIKVVTESGTILGYIKAALAQDLASLIDAGYEVHAYLSDILGYEDAFGDVNSDPYGCEIIVTIYDK